MMDNFEQTPDKQAELLREEEDAALVRAAVVFACVYTYYGLCDLLGRVPGNGAKLRIHNVCPEDVLSPLSKKHTDLVKSEVRELKDRLNFYFSPDETDEDLADD